MTINNILLTPTRCCVQDARNTGKLGERDKKWGKFSVVQLLYVGRPWNEAWIVIEPTFSDWLGDGCSRIQFEVKVAGRSAGSHKRLHNIKSETIYICTPGTLLCSTAETQKLTYTSYQVYKVVDSKLHFEALLSGWLYLKQMPGIVSSIAYQ